MEAWRINGERRVARCAWQDASRRAAVFDIGLFHTGTAGTKGQGDWKS